MYRFQSQATADLLLLQAQGDALLRLLGREPGGAGTLTVEQLPAAQQRLAQAIVAAEAAAAAAAAAADDPDAPAAPDVAELRRRLWPVQQMLQRAAEAGVPVVWGV